MIHRAMDVIEGFVGKRSVGWLGPGLTQTLETPDLLAEAGVRYIGDWVYDDEPTTIATTHGPLVTLPYTFETHDLATMVLQHHEAPLRKSARTRSTAMPNRPRAPSHGDRPASLHQGPAAPDQYLEAIYEHASRNDGVVYWTGEEILDWYLKSGTAGV